MISVMLDNDIAGHRDLFDGTLHNTGWDGYRLVEFVTMDEAGIVSDAPDSEVWRFCQQRRLLLLTANRNLDDESSLERTLREDNTSESLPIITVSAPQRIVEPEYRERCMHALVGIVLDLENCLGACQVVHSLRDTELAPGNPCRLPTKCAVLFLSRATNR